MCGQCYPPLPPPTRGRWKFKQLKGLIKLYPPPPHLSGRRRVPWFQSLWKNLVWSCGSKIIFKLYNKIRLNSQNYWMRNVVLWYKDKKKVFSFTIHQAKLASSGKQKSRMVQKLWSLYLLPSTIDYGWDQSKWCNVG